MIILTDIAIDGGDIVPRSIGEKLYPPTEIWTPTSRPIGRIPAAAYTGETPIHRAQKVMARLPGLLPIVNRPTPIKNLLRKFMPRIARRR